jgi:hypothetical protein
VIIGWGLVRRRARRVATSDPADATVWLEWPVAAPPQVSPMPDRKHRRRDQVTVPLLAGLVAALIVAPWVGVLVAALLVGMQWRPRLRAVLVLGPAVCMALVLAYVVYLQHHFRFPPLFEWPTLFPLGRPLGWLAVVFLGADVFAERVRTRASEASRAGPG